MVLVLGVPSAAVLVIWLMVRWTLGRTRRERIEELERQVEEMKAERE